MENQYNIRLLTFNITDIEASIHVKDTEQLQMSGSFQLQMREPKSSDDPTVMLNVTATLSDQEEHLVVKCTANYVFQFDPIPSDWINAVKEHCPSLIQDEMIRRTHQILKAMGHTLTVPGSEE